VPVASLEELLATQRAVREVTVKAEVAEYMLRIVERTRSHPQIDLGVSTRGALSLFRAGQARAFLEGRDYVSPDDYQRLAIPVLAHRIQLNSQARYGGRTAATLIAELLGDVAVPL